MGVRSVVIVEDEPETADMLVEMMRLIGFQTYSCPTGLKAVDLIAEKKPTTILLDQMMPELSGLEVLRSLRLDPRLRDIPVIIVSAKSMPADMKEALDAGAAYYLTKPISFVDLKSAVETVTSNLPGLS